MKHVIYYLLVLLAFLLAATSCNPYGSQIPEKLNGCWVSRDNGRWEYGFFEEFAIYNNDFWRYYSVSDTEIVLYSRGAAAHTKNNGKQLGIALDSTAITLKISFEGDSILNVNGKRYWQFNTPYELQGTADGLSQIAHNDFEKLIDYPNTQPDTADFDATAQGNAVVMIYERNTAQGFRQFARRFEVNRHDLYDFYNPGDTASWTKFVGKPMGGVSYFYSKTEFPRYMSSGAFFPKNIDFDEHYGERYVFNVWVNGVTEFAADDLMHINRDGYHDPRTYIVEPGDTLMLFFDRWSANPFGSTVITQHHIMGTNERFSREVDAFYNDIIWSVAKYNNDLFAWERQQMSDTAYWESRSKRYTEDSTLLETYLKNCPIPMSKKFVRYSRNQLLYNYAANIANNALADDYLAQKFSQLNEDDLYLSSDALDFACKLIPRNQQHFYGSLAHTRESLEQHPDFIIDRNGGLVNPEVLRNLGLTDKFIDDFRYCSFISFMNDWRFHTDNNGMVEDYDIDNVLRNITNEQLRENLKTNIELHQQYMKSQAENSQNK